MSLINDALKRAKQTQKQRLPAGGPPLQPHDSNHGSSKSVVLILIVLLALGGAAYYYYSGKKLPFGLSEKFGRTPAATNSVAQRKFPRRMIATTRPTNAPPGAKTAATPPTNQRPAPVSAPGASRSNLVATAPAPTSMVRAPEAALQLEEPKPAEPIVASHGKTPEKAPLAEPLTSRTETERTFPALRLQGIFFRYPRPSVLINGKTLYRGDKVEGATVVEIERHQVKVEFGDQTKVLALQ